MLGGGWKQFYTQQVDKKTFYELAYRVLGIGDEDIVEFFGAAEHPILYCDCKNHHFHVPAYSRVIIRDVNTLHPLENGKTGLINLITPMIKATPILSVMTMIWVFCMTEANAAAESIPLIWRSSDVSD